MSPSKQSCLEKASRVRCVRHCRIASRQAVLTQHSTRALCQPYSRCERYASTSAECAEVKVSEPQRVDRQLRNDTTYPSHARVREQDFVDATMHFNFSQMGVDFAASARAHQLEVEELRAQQRAEDETKRREQALQAAKALEDAKRPRARHLRGARRRKAVH